MKTNILFFAVLFISFMLLSSCMSSQKGIAYNELEEHLDEDGDIYWDDYAN